MFTLIVKIQALSIHLGSSHQHSNKSEMISHCVIYLCLPDVE